MECYTFGLKQERKIRVAKNIHYNVDKTELQKELESKGFTLCGTYNSLSKITNKSMQEKKYNSL